MYAYLVALCWAAGIYILFQLNRERSVRTSPALWLAVIWLSIAGSRNIGEWLQPGGKLDLGTVYRDVEGSPVDRTVLSLLLAAGIATLINRRRRTGALLKANPAVVAFFVYCAISVLWSDYPFVGLKRWFRGIGDFVMVLVILTDPDPGAALRRALTRTGFVLLPVSILLMKYFPEYGRAYVPWTGEVMWTGVTAFKNTLGQTCLIYGLAAIWCFFLTWRSDDRRRRKRRLFAQGLIIAIAVFLLWLSDSQTSLACFVLACGLMVTVSCSAFARRPAILHPMVLVLVTVPFAVLFMGVGDSALETMGRDPTLTGRTDIWSVALRHVENPLLGAGYENFWLGKRREKLGREIGVFFNQSHNGYLETYLNLGWVGVTLLAFLIISGYRNIVKKLRGDPALYSLSLAYFVVALVYNFTEGAVEMMCSVWIVFLIATMADFRPLRARPEPRRYGLHDPLPNDELVTAS